jgi:hypothetical protein
MWRFEVARISMNTLLGSLKIVEFHKDVGSGSLITCLHQKCGMMVRMITRIMVRLVSVRISVEHGAVYAKKPGNPVYDHVRL